MELLSEKNFVVPVVFVSIKEIGISVENEKFSYKRYYENVTAPKIMDTSREGVSEYEVDMVKQKAKKQIEYKFHQIKDISKVLTSNQVLQVHLDIFKALWEAHVNNLPCFSSIKDSPINGMTYDQVLDMHLNTFKKNYTLHYTMLKCDDDTAPKVSRLSSEELITKGSKISTEVDSLFKSLMNSMKNFTIDQVLQVDYVILETIINLHVKNVACFNNIDVNGINGMTYKEIIQMHLDKFKETFNMHLNLLGCK